MDTQIARAALSCLKEYFAYAEEMREIGRGFYPTGHRGEDVECVIAALEAEVSSELRPRSPEELAEITEAILGRAD